MLRPTLILLALCLAVVPHGFKDKVLKTEEGAVGVVATDEDFTIAVTPDEDFTIVVAPDDDFTVAAAPHEGVTGFVTLDGQPLANATVYFIPTDEEVPVSSGKTNEKGEYKLQKLDDADASTAPGRYKIQFECAEEPETGDAVQESGQEAPEAQANRVLPER